MDELQAQQACPPNTAAYAIQAGDTVFKLARVFGTTVDDILALNPGLDPDALQVARIICIPRQPQYPKCPGGRYYVVRRGDTMFDIARRNNLALGELIGANPQADPNTLAIGQVLCIPSEAPAPQPGPCPEGQRAYTVVAGDTMFLIAQRFNVPLAALLAANPSVDPNRLMIGQVVCVPG